MRLDENERLNDIGEIVHDGGSGEGLDHNRGGSLPIESMEEENELLWEEKD